MFNNDERVFYGLGVDFSSDFKFENGDIKLTRYQDNLIQAVINRLNTNLNELEFYGDYGCKIKRFLGWKANPETLQFIESEISNVLDNETRLTGHDCTCTYNGKGNIRIELVLQISTDMSVPVNLVIGTDGVIELEENANNMED